VPRVWEKIQEKMAENEKSVVGFRKTIMTWAKSKGVTGHYNEQKDASKPWGWFLAKQLLFKKVKLALGLDRCIAAFTGAAPISKNTLEHFMSVGIPIYEMYGMSECTGPHTFSAIKLFGGTVHECGYRTGSCGVLFNKGIKTVINKDTKEICMKGRHVMMGYMYDKKATDACIDSKGWLHTGDTGKLDSDGFLYITGRIKELIITAGGENVAPLPIEDAMKLSLSDFVSNCMCVGDRKKFVSLLITLKVKLNDDNTPSNKLSDSVVEFFNTLGQKISTVEDAQSNAIFNGFIREGIAEGNKQLPSKAAHIKEWRILPVDFSLQGGELGPTLKLKRRVVLEKYSDLIDEIYSQ